MFVPLSVRDATPYMFSQVRYQEFLRTALSRHSVLIFPKYGCLDPDDHVRIGSIFGPLQESLAEVDESHPANRLVQVIERNVSGGVSDPRRPSSYYWHTDRSFLADPAAVTLLNMRHPAESGGSTEFTSMRDGFGRLAPQEQEALRSASALHSYSHYHRILEAENIPSDKKEIACKLYDDVWHRLVIKDSTTGIEAIYYSELCVAEIRSNGIPEADSVSLDWLKNKIITNARTYTHKWQPGDLVVWNNFAVMHRSSPSRGYRHLHRVVVGGMSAIGDS